MTLIQGFLLSELQCYAPTGAVRRDESGATSDGSRPAIASTSILYGLQLGQRGPEEQKEADQVNARGPKQAMIEAMLLMDRTKNR